MSDVIISRRGSYKTGTGGQMVTEIITFNTNWVVPEGVKDNRFYVRLIGAGGQGPNYESSGGSGIMNNSELILTPNEIIPITIGRPVNTSGTGNTTSFGIYLSGAGGRADESNPYGGSGGRGYYNGGDGLQFGGGGGWFGSGGNGGTWGGGGGGHSAGMSSDSNRVSAGSGGIYGGGGGGGAGHQYNGGNGGKYGGGGGACYAHNGKGGIGGEFGGNGGNGSNHNKSFVALDFNYMKYINTTNAKNGTNTIGFNDIEFRGKGEAGGPPKLIRVEWNSNRRWHCYMWGGAPGGGGYGGNGGTSNSVSGGGGGGYGSNGGSVGLLNYSENQILSQWGVLPKYVAGGGGGGYGGDGESDLNGNRSAAGGGYGKQSIGRGGGGGGYYCPGGGFLSIEINPNNSYVLGGGGLGIHDGKTTYASFGSGGTYNGTQKAESGVCIIQYYI